MCLGSCGGKIKVGAAAISVQFKFIYIDFYNNTNCLCAFYRDPEHDPSAIMIIVDKTTEQEKIWMCFY